MILVGNFHVCIEILTVGFFAGNDLSSRLYNASQAYAHGGEDAIEKLQEFWSTQGNWSQRLEKMVTEQCKGWKKMEHNPALNHVWPLGLALTTADGKSVQERSIAIVLALIERELQEQGGLPAGFSQEIVCHMAKLLRQPNRSHFQFDF